MRSRYAQMAAVLVACLIVTVALASQAYAHKTFLTTVKSAYSLGASNGKCNTCHGLKGGPNRKNLNPYGTALQGDEDMKGLLNRKTDYVFNAEEIKNLLKSAGKLDSKDTDGDGATNREELLLGTNPGDPDNKPVAATLENFRKAEKAKEEAKAKADAKKK